MYYIDPVTKARKYPWSEGQGPVERRQNRTYESQDRAAELTREREDWRARAERAESFLRDLVDEMYILEEGALNGGVADLAGDLGNAVLKRFPNLCADTPEAREYRRRRDLERDLELVLSVAASLAGRETPFDDSERAEQAKALERLRVALGIEEQ